MTKTKAIGRSPALPLGAIDLPGKTASVPAARAHVQQLLSGLDIERLHIVLLLVTELVSNAVRHSESGRNPNGQVRVMVTVDSDLIHVDVIDEGSVASTPQVRAQMALPGPGGYGLQLVDRLADDWGHHEVDGGRAVWFESGPQRPPEPKVPANAKSRDRLTRTDVTREPLGGRMAEPSPNNGLPREPTPLKHATAAGTGGGTPSPSRQTKGSRETPIAVRRQAIIERLAEKIASGELAEGSRLPSSQELMGTYSIPHSAARFIQRELRDRRIIRLVQGRWYPVGVPEKTPPPPRTYVQDRITEICTELVTKIRRREIRPRRRVASQRQLMNDYNVSRYIAQAILARLVGRGWAYDDTPDGGVYASVLISGRPPVYNE